MKLHLLSLFLIGSVSLYQIALILVTILPDRFHAVEWCHQMLAKIDSVFDIATSDESTDHINTSNESLFYCYEPETKRQSTQWVFFPFEELPTKVKSDGALKR